MRLRIPQKLLLVFALSISGLWGLEPFQQVFAQESLFPKDVSLYIILDESTTMWDTFDPDDYRIDAVETLIDTLGSIPNISVRVSIVMFGDEAVEVAKLETIGDAQARAALKERLRTIHNQGPQGWSAIDKAWDRVFQLVQKEHSNAVKPAILVLTDGQPQTEEASKFRDPQGVKLAEYLEQVRDAYGRFLSFNYTGQVCPPHKPQQGIPLYVVAIGEGVQQAANAGLYHNIWQQLADNSGGLYFRLNEVPKLASETLGMIDPWLCIPTGEDEELPLAGNGELNYAIPAVDAVESISVVVLKGDQEAQLNVQLLDPQQTLATPDGQNVVRNTSDGDEVWSLRRHSGWEGSWTLRVTSNRDTTVRIRFIPISNRFTVQFDQPGESIYPRGKELPIAIRVLNSNGQSIMQELENISIEVRNIATGVAEPITQVAAPQGNALQTSYLHTLLSDAKDTGDRDVVFKAALKIGNHRLPIQATKRVTLSPWPWLSVLAPTAGYEYTRDQEVPLAVQVLVEERPDEVTAQTAPITARIVDATGVVVWEEPLIFDPALNPSALSATVPTNQLVEGDYTVEYILPAGNTAPREDRVNRTFKMIKPPPPTATSTPLPTATPTLAPTPTLTPTPTPPPPPFRVRYRGLLQVVGAFAGLMLLMGTVGVIRSQPRLDGMSLTPKSGEERFLRGRLYKFELGDVGDGQPEATLAIRPRRSTNRGVVAEVTVEKLAPGVEDIQVGEDRITSSRFSQGKFDWRSGHSIFVGDDQITLHNPNET